MIPMTSMRADVAAAASPALGGAAPARAAASPSITLIMRVDAGIDAAVEIAAAKARNDDVFDDAIGDGVRQHAFQTVPDFDAQLAIVLRDQQQRAVVDAFAAELPLLDDAHGILLDRLRACVVGTISTRDLAAFARFERCELLLELTAPDPALNVPVRSVTRALSGGTATGSCAQASVRPQSASSRSPARRGARFASIALLLGSRRCGRRRWRCNGGLAEIHGRRFRDRGFVLDREVGLLFVAEDHRRQVDRKLTHGDVVLLHRIDVALARDRDAILGALELRLQIAEVLVGFEVADSSRRPPAAATTPS